MDHSHRSAFVFSSSLSSSDASVHFQNLNITAANAMSPILAGHPNCVVIAKPDLNNSPAVCRICYSGEESGPNDGEPLISPCHCKGTMGLYHRTCLNKWLVVSQKTHCEICQFKFQLKRTSPSFFAYVRSGQPRPVFGLPFTIRGTLLTDFMCFLLLTPLVLLSATVCFLSGLHLLQGNNAGIMTADGPHKEIGVALLCLSTLLLFAYFFWLGVTFFYHRRDYRSWQSQNWNYTVVDQLSMEESMMVNGTRSGGGRRRRNKQRQTRNNC